MMTVSPSAIRCAAAAAIRCFSSRWTEDRSLNELSAVARPATATAPPYVRETAPCLASQSRSRRTVSAETPNVSASSVTVAWP